MKTNAYNIAIAMFAISATIFGCKKDTLMPFDHVDATAVKKELPALAPNQDNIKVLEMNNPKLLDAYLVKGKWKVQSMANDGSHGVDVSQQLVDFTFAFNQKGGIIAEKNGKGFPGKWESFFEKDGTKLVLEFGAQPLISLNDTWTTLLVNKNVIRLVKPGKVGMLHLDLINVLDDEPLVKTDPAL